MAFRFTGSRSGSKSQRTWRGRLSRLLTGVAVQVALLATCPAPPTFAQSFRLLYNFQGAINNDGALPNQLVQASDGYFYGTTGAGGIATATSVTFGTVLRMDVFGHTTILHTFLIDDIQDPIGPLIQATDGYLYGTTNEAGAPGAVYRIRTDGTGYTVLHQFSGSDGGCTQTGVMQATDGNFYGTTLDGGDNNLGVVFKMDVRGNITVLHSFGGADGSHPQSGLIQGANGLLYGTAYDGGMNSNSGVIFSIDTAGNYAVLHNFDRNNLQDAYYPNGPLLQAPDGTFYGTTEYGGYYGSGSVFEMGSSGALTVLYSFQGEDGSSPYGNLVLGRDGYLYGVTYYGGVNNAYGTLYRMDTSGNHTILHTFPQNGNAGEEPNSLIQGREGCLYGSCNIGGSTTQGTLWRVMLGLTHTDFSGNGQSDVVWQDLVTGDVSVWYMNGSAYTNSADYLGHGIPLEWKIVGTPDLNGDAHPDLLWQSGLTGDVSYWLMNGGTFVSSGYVAHGVPLEWKIVGTPDLNHDGIPDLLWLNQQTGDVSYWIMNGTDFVYSGFIAHNIPLEWTVVGTPDVNGDGQADILWQNQLTGDVSYWIMDGTQVVSTGFIAHGIPLEWKIVGTPDFAGDGVPDILWQSSKSGDVSYWLMNNEQFVASGFTAYGVPLEWIAAASQ